MFGSVAYIGDIYVGMEGWVLSLPPCSSPELSDLLCVSCVRMSRRCRGNDALWYFTPHLNQWPLYLTTPGNYLAGRLDHVNSRPTSWGREGGREAAEKVAGVNRKQIKARGQKQNTQTEDACDCLPARFSQAKARPRRVKQLFSLIPSSFIYYSC